MGGRAVDLAVVKEEESVLQPGRDVGGLVVTIGEWSMVMVECKKARAGKEWKMSLLVMGGWCPGE